MAGLGLRVGMSPHILTVLVFGIIVPPIRIPTERTVSIRGTSQV